MDAAEAGHGNTLPLVADTPVSISFALQHAETAAALRLSWHTLTISLTPPLALSHSLSPFLPIFPCIIRLIL